HLCPLWNEKRHVERYRVAPRLRPPTACTGLTAPATTRRDKQNGAGSRLVAGHPPIAPAARNPATTPPLQCDREAGRRARHAVDRGDLVGHEATDGVERRALDDGDEFEPPGHRVEVA